ncbi:MAG: penicillin-binding protein 2 [candidate division Zixibacteria bacterium]|nr:penicillin-binding protein 2 [candidate division Zixibacteria bacterium]
MKSKIQRYEGKRDFRSEKRRLGFWLVVFSLFSLVVFARLWSIQITHGAEYREIALRQSAGKAPILAPRGAIYDRAGREVAVDVIRHSLCVYPMTQKEAEITEKYLDRLYKRRNGYSRKAHKIQPKRFRWIERGIDDQLALRIKSESPKGVFVREERGRDFPFGLVGKQILGYTDIDNRGISGIESRYDDLLRGVDGVADIQRDGLSKVYRVEERPLLQPSPGSSLILTIDWEFQEIVEEELVKAVNKHNALGGCAAFVDVYTGEILAAAHFDCDEKFPERPTKLKAITDCFEPGSIYKFVMAAAILDERPSLADTSYYCEEGRWLCGTRYLHDDKKHGDLTLCEIIEFSSNIGTAKLAIELGAESLVRSSQRFGFGQRTRVDFPGEQSGVLHTDMVWSDYNIAALSIGHSVSVTPLQMCMAMAAIANGGELYQPRLTRGSISSKGIASESKKPKKIGRVMKKQSSEILRSYLRGVVTHGTATKVNSNTVAIAGKTGTAEIPRTDGRGYLKNKFVASFAGYFPADSRLCNPFRVGVLFGSPTQGALTPFATLGFVVKLLRSERLVIHFVCTFFFFPYRLCALAALRENSSRKDCW